MKHLHKIMNNIALWISKRKSIPYRFKRSVAKRLYPEMLKNYPFELDFFGLRYQGTIMNYIDRIVYFCGAHEKFILFFMRDYVKKLNKEDITMLDIGANVGNHSLFMSKYASKIFAYEPYELVRKQLENKIAINNIKNVIITPVGLGKENATLPFYAPPSSNLGIGSFNKDFSGYNKYMGDLKIVVGDEEMKEKNIDHIDLIKIDVEGFERFALEGLKYTIEKSRPLIILELSAITKNSFSNFEDFRSIFPDNYSFYRFAKGKQDSGHYKLAEFDYNKEYKMHDIIACPNENLSLIS